MTEWMKGNELEIRKSGGDLGGTMRLGAFDATLQKGSHIAEIYGNTRISERHRHRYEVNTAYREKLEKAGLKFAGMSPDGLLPETVEYPDHPWFIGVQYHPELKSKPFEPPPVVCLIHRGCSGAKPHGVMLAAFFKLVFAALLTVLLFVPASAYDEVKLKDAERSAILLQAQLKSLTNRLNSPSLADDALASNRLTLEKLKAAANTGAEKASGPLNEISKQVEGLGAPPAPDAPPEPETIANQRKELNAQLARATAVQKQLTLVSLEADQAMARLTDLQRENFLQRIFKADKSILNPALWTSMIDSGSLMWARVSNLVSRGIADASGSLNWSGFLLLPVGLGVLGLLFLKLIPGLMNRLGLRMAEAGERSYSGLEKLWFVIWSYVKYLAVMTVLVILFMSSLEVAGLLTPTIENLTGRLMDALEPALLYGGLMYFVTAPRHPAYRLLAIDTSAARILFAVVAFGYLVYGFGEELSNFATSINLPVSFTVGQTALTALAMIMFIATGLVVVRRQAAKGLATEGSTYFLTWFMSFLPLWWILVLVAVLALLFGFIALSYFIAGNLLDTAMLAVTMGLLHAFIDAATAAIVDPQSRTGHAVRRFTALSDQGIQRTVLVLRTLADAVLIIVTLLSLVALWTVVLFDVAGFVGSLGQGLTIGNITLSPKAILTALAVLFVGITATKYITRWLERRVLAETQLDKGVQNSLRAVAGYTGYSLAGAFALTAAGLDFSSLAIVFGALVLVSVLVCSPSPTTLFRASYCWLNVPFAWVTGLSPMPVKA